MSRPLTYSADLICLTYAQVPSRNQLRSKGLRGYGYAYVEHLHTIIGYALPSLRSLRAYRGELTPSRGGMLRSLVSSVLPRRSAYPPLDLNQPDSAMQASLRQNAQVSSPRYAEQANLP